MELGWSNVIQAVVLAACTWYMRRGSKKDNETAAQEVIRQTASPVQVTNVGVDVITLKAEVETLKRQIRDLSGDVGEAKTGIITVRDLTLEVRDTAKRKFGEFDASFRKLGAPTPVEIEDITKTDIGKVRWEK